jgi:hypothetical protein
MEQEAGQPSRKKPFFPIATALRRYLKTHGREVALPVSYNDLTHFSYSVPILDASGRDTLWEKALYDMNEWTFLRENLLKVYAILKTEGDFTFTKHLDLARIDYCSFGNSNPFRIRIVNRFNDNYDHFYIKREDASRVYGLELEDILSPNRITFLTGNSSLIEEHIPGLPGDVYVKKYLALPETNKIRLAKELQVIRKKKF